MVNLDRSRSLVLGVLSDFKPKSAREIAKATGLGRDAVYGVLSRCWRRGLVLRTEKPIYVSERIFRGRAGVSRNTRPYHLYVLRPENVDSLLIDGRRFVKYSKKYLDVRGGGKKSKAKLILEFLMKHRDKAFFSRDIAEALESHDIKTRDVMSAVRRYEKKGLVYVRGYVTENRQTQGIPDNLDRTEHAQKAGDKGRDRKNQQSFKQHGLNQPYNRVNPQNKRHNPGAYVAPETRGRSVSPE